MYDRHHRILREIGIVLDGVDSSEVDALCDEIVGARRIVVLGAGRMGMACRGFAMRLAHLGCDAHALGDATVPSIAVGDLLLIASGSGETASIKLLAETAVRNGSNVAVVTARRESSIAKLAKTVVIIPAPTKAANEALVVSTQPLTTLNEQCAQIFFDSVVLQLMVRLGETSDSMWARHSNLE